MVRPEDWPLNIRVVTVCLGSPANILFLYLFAKYSIYFFQTDNMVALYLLTLPFSAFVHVSLVFFYCRLFTKFLHKEFFEKLASRDHVLSSILTVITFFYIFLMSVDAQPGENAGMGFLLVFVFLGLLAFYALLMCKFVFGFILENSEKMLLAITAVSLPLVITVIYIAFIFGPFADLFGFK